MTMTAARRNDAVLGFMRIEALRVGVMVHASCGWWLPAIDKNISSRQIEVFHYTLKAQPLLGSPKHRTPRFDRGVLADWFLSPVKNIPVISFSTQMVTLVSSVSVGTVCFTSKKSRSDFLAIFGYLFERNT